jgi:hypothetical protein
MERHCICSSSSHNDGRKKGSGSWSPLPSVFSLHLASSDVHDAATHGACFSPPAASVTPQTCAWLKLEELDQRWVEEGGAQPATRKEEQTAQALALDLR